MRKADVSRARPGLLACGPFLLAVVMAGCSNEEGTVAGAPKLDPDALQAPPSTKGATPKVPRGPGQVKALQDAKTK